MKPQNKVYIGFLVLILFACAKKVPEHQFYYSNGIRIQDSTSIQLISKDIQNILNTNGNQDLNIRTTLHAQNAMDCPELLDLLRSKSK